jgi:hypothetical protein
VHRRREPAGPGDVALVVGGIYPHRQAEVQPLLDRCCPVWCNYRPDREAAAGEGRRRGIVPGAGPSTPASGSASSPSADRLPDYQPATLVSKSAYSTVLTSPDSVSKIGEFYRNALATGGWQVTASSMSAYHASFTASRSNEGVSVSVYSRGSGSGISISTHPSDAGAARGA